MQAHLLTPRIINLVSFCFLLAIGLTPVTASTISAADKSPPLEVKSVDGDGKLALYDTIKITVANLPQWVTITGNDLSKLILYIDGNAFKGIPPALIENNNKLQFHLKRDPKDKEAWNAVLSRKRDDFFTRKVPVTVGFENGVQVTSSVKSTLEVINRTWFLIFVIIFGGAIFMFLGLACRSDIIRETGPQPEGIDQRKPYSLARTQMACWFFTIIISYFFIWIVTHDLSILTASVLGLMGISAGTGLFSAVVDSGKRSDLGTLEEKRKNNAAEADRLRNEITALNTAMSATPPPTNLEEQRIKLEAKKTELAAKESEIAQANQKMQALTAAAKSPASKGFKDDILSDDNGVSFHRFQISIWTIVLIIMFIYTVYNTLAMPEFDATLLGLMGISSGTYIGFKLPKQPG
ncbi:MAG: hypothetical protein A2Y80_00945 [Deltaproteobacteria bacterium RBG_13_58_19]|nr:MAG: hypothetical protein A2Y80_00945 [Deltaproteobacteria bacterium RBG_13_58_19]